MGEGESASKHKYELLSFTKRHREWLRQEKNIQQIARAVKNGRLLEYRTMCKAAPELMKITMDGEPAHYLVLKGLEGASSNDIELGKTIMMELVKGNQETFQEYPVVRRAKVLCRTIGKPACDAFIKYLEQLESQLGLKKVNSNNIDLSSLFV